MQLKKDYAGRDFLSLLDYTTEDLQYFLEVADYLKAEHKAGRPTPYLQGKTMGLIFEKSSTRTRVSFEAGIYYLGGQGLFLSSNDLQIGRGEPIKDTARVLSRFLNGLMIRTFSHDIVLELAQYADIPVINGLTDLLHPCQVLADLQTIREHKGKLAGLKLAFIGDGNNMAHSLMNGGARMGMHVAVACPDGYQPDAAVLARAQAAAKESGGSVAVLADPMAAAAGADVIYTDVWASMGQEAEKAEREKIFGGVYQVNDELMAVANPGAMVLHCLPAHRGEEITEAVFEAHPEIFDEAENRLYAQMAVMALLLA
ncbi:MAG: ornithine carbamoyltransferase [Peptococcaceae bacterium]|nr:ornithine carbamoyltransferase [Peptococcaceae bacterium]